MGTVFWDVSTNMSKEIHV